jgi:hypothetical protein
MGTNALAVDRAARFAPRCDIALSVRPITSPSRVARQSRSIPPAPAPLRWTFTRRARFTRSTSTAPCSAQATNGHLLLPASVLRQREPITIPFDADAAQPERRFPYDLRAVTGVPAFPVSISRISRQSGRCLQPSVEAVSNGWRARDSARWTQAFRRNPAHLPVFAFPPAGSRSASGRGRGSACFTARTTRRSRGNATRSSIVCRRTTDGQYRIPPSASSTSR